VACRGSKHLAGHSDHAAGDPRGPALGRSPCRRPADRKLICLSLKRRYGKALTLIGNIDLDYVMTRAPPGEVEEVMKRTIDAAAPGGGFILDSVPPANAIAMYETARC
jgi:hypothetical protein